MARYHVRRDTDTWLCDVWFAAGKIRLAWGTHQEKALSFPSETMAQHFAAIGDEVVGAPKTHLIVRVNDPATLDRG